MSIQNLKSETHSPKRRKLYHGSKDSDLDFPDASSGPDGDSAGSEPDDESPEEVQGKRIASTKQPGQRDLKSNKTKQSKPNVLPTGGISKSAILALQVSDLNAEVSPDYERLRPKWSAISNKLASLIRDMPQRESMTATDASKSFRKQGIKIPFPQPTPTKDTNYKFEFRPPRHVVVGGALAHGLSLKNENAIEITVILPEDVLQEKDYLNTRAFHKGAFYLACIATAIKEQQAAEFDMSFVDMSDVYLLPAIKLVPKDASLSKFTFWITVGFPDDSIPRAKTLPTKNCLRLAASGNSDQSNQPTPFYNSAIRSAAATSAFEQLVKSARSDAFDEACRIGQLWLRQRGFSSSLRAGGFGFTEWSRVCALLLSTGGHQGYPLFSKQYSSLQFFKAMLQVLSGRDLQQQPMLLNTADLELSPSDVPVIFDAKTGVNVLYKMSPWSYQSLRHHARLSLASVNSKIQDSLDSTFVLNIAVPLLQYDEVYSLTVPETLLPNAAEERKFLHELHAVLTRGLGDRITLLDFKLPQSSDWSLSETPLHGKEKYVVQIALLTNPETVTRLVDHGPAADEPEEAAQFQKFWGEKAELRRFKDGSISEALVWKQGAVPVTLQIISHLTMMHFKILPSAVRAETQNLESSILRDDEFSAVVSPKDAFRVINSTFQTLTSTLHNLDGLPLPIRSISPTDPALRSSTTVHPLLPSTTSPIDILIQFDSSTRWPDSLPAIQHTKIAFLLKLSELLGSNDDTTQLTTRVGLENTDSATTGYFNTSFLDIIYPSPAPGLSPICFRLRIYHDRESHLLQTALKDKSLHGSVRDSLALALATHKRDFQAKSIHTTTIRNLITRFPPLSATIRLLKKWLSSHLLLSVHVPEEIVELIAAHVFLHPAPWSTPGSSTTAFLRCLHLLSRWDWSFSPLIVDLSLSQDGITEAQRAEMETRFQAWRKLDPNMNNVVWFVGSSIDNTGTVWSGSAHPARVVAGRVTALARAAMEVVDSGSLLADQHWKTLFVSDLAHYDFVIHLKASVVRGYKAKSKSKSRQSGISADDGFKNLQIAQTLDVDSIGYDPVALYLRDLTDAFGSAAVLFCDVCGGANVVAGLWRPSVLGTKEWRVRQGWSSVPVPDEGDGKEMCVLNKEAVVAEMVGLGEGLVKEVSVKE